MGRKSVRRDRLTHDFRVAGEGLGEAEGSGKVCLTTNCTNGHKAWVMLGIGGVEGRIQRVRSLDLPGAGRRDLKAGAGSDLVMGLRPGPFA